jgi:RNA polymerase sigma-70 factor (ECF subfamily)
MQRMMLTDLQIVERAKLGDVDAFERLYHMHKQRAFGLCLRMTRSIPTAEDLTQEIFLLVFRKIRTFRGQAQFSTWLHRVSVNVVLMHLRDKSIPETSLEEWAPREWDGHFPPGGLVRMETSVEDLVLHSVIDRVNLERAIGELPRGYRMVFVLHDVEGYAHKKIADMLSCSTGTTKSQLHKARLKLRTLLKGTGKKQARGERPKVHLSQSVDYSPRAANL